MMLMYVHGDNTRKRIPRDCRGGALTKCNQKMSWADSLSFCVRGSTEAMPSRSISTASNFKLLEPRPFSRSLHAAARPQHDEDEPEAREHAGHCRGDAADRVSREHFLLRLVERLSFRVQRSALLDRHEAFELQGAACTGHCRHPWGLLSLCALLLADNLAVFVLGQVRRLQATNGLLLGSTEHHGVGHSSLCNLAHLLLLLLWLFHSFLCLFLRFLSFFHCFLC